MGRRSRSISQVMVLVVVLVGIGGFGSGVDMVWWVRWCVLTWYEIIRDAQ